MKQPCKHINEGSSCSLNNNCRYPECEKVPSAEDFINEVSPSKYGIAHELRRDGSLRHIKQWMQRYAKLHTRLHLEALAENIGELSPTAKYSAVKALNDYLAKNKLEK